jgi:hypothetical protein
VVLTPGNVNESSVADDLICGDEQAVCRVEEGRGGLRLGQSLRFPSPLIKPDVRICRIRLSDRLHVRLSAGAAGVTRVRRRTSSFPKIWLQE